MKRLIISNAFSLNMLCENYTLLEVSDVKGTEEVADFLYTYFDVRRFEVVNAIGHLSTDIIVHDMFIEYDIDIPKGQRVTVDLKKGDYLLVAQYQGPRLPEGVTELPEGAQIVFRYITIKEG